MSAKSIEAARAFVRVAWEDSAIRRGIARAAGMLKTFAAGVSQISFGSLLADGIRAATSAVFDFVDAGAKIDDIANRTGATAESLSQLKYAAEQSGTSIEDIEKGMRMLADVQTEAARGGSAAAKSLARVGLSAKDLEGLSPDQKLLAVAEALKNVEDPAERSSLAMDLLGKSGANLLPLMEDGAAGIQALMTEANALGMTLSGDQAKAAADFDDAWAKLKGTFGAVGKILGSVVMPYLTTFINIVLQAIPYISKFYQVVGTMWVRAFEAAWNAIQPLIQTFKPLGEAIMETFSALGNALMSGEYAAAAKVLWTSLKAAWLTGIDGLNREWILWKKAFLDVFNSAMAAVQKAWHKTQNFLSKGVIEVMAVFDSSINVDQVNAELDSMLQQQLKSVESQTNADQKARDQQFEQDVLAVNTDLAQARDEWRAAVNAANQVAKKKANEPGAAQITDDKFTKLIDELKTGDIATRINDSVKASNNQIGDVRTLSGASQLTQLINRTGRLEQQMVTFLGQIAKNTTGINAQPQVVNI